MKNSIFHQQANSVTDRVLQEIKHDNQNVREKIIDTEAKISSVLETIIDTRTENDENTPPAPQVNLVATDAVNMKMIKLLTDMQKKNGYIIDW